MWIFKLFTELISRYLPVIVQRPSNCINGQPLSQMNKFLPCNEPKHRSRSAKDVYNRIEADRGLTNLVDASYMLLHVCFAFFKLLPFTGCTLGSSEGQKPEVTSIVIGHWSGVNFTWSNHEDSKQTQNTSHAKRRGDKYTWLQLHTCSNISFSTHIHSAHTQKRFIK